MPATSKAQQKFMGIVHGIQKGTIKPSDVSGAAKKVAKTMKKKSAKDFAKTKHKGLPNKVKGESRLYENPAASAAAAMAMMQLQNPDTGKKVSAATPLKDKDHQLHSKAKSIFKRLKDKFSKKKPEKKNGVVHNFMKKDFKRESVNEDGHTDVASIERKLKLIIQDSVDTIKKLRSMSNEDSLPSWWTDKITLAKDYVSKSRDYIMNPAESVNEISGIDLAKKVVKNKQHEKGMDLFTAQYIVQTYDAYKKHPELRKKIEKLSVPKAVKLANLVMKGR